MKGRKDIREKERKIQTNKEERKWINVEREK
jgi:hypothetical protein